MEHEGKTFAKLCMAYNKTWHTWHKQCHNHSSWWLKPWTEAHLANGFQLYHGNIFPTFPWLQDLCLQWDRYSILIALVGRQITMEIIHHVKMTFLLKLMIIHKTKNMSFQGKLNRNSLNSSLEFFQRYSWPSKVVYQLWFQNLSCLLTGLDEH